MEKIWQVIQDASLSGTEVSLQSVVLSLLLAFVLGQMLAWTYYFTHSGLSYSRAFVQSLILITVIVSMVMSTIAGSFVVAVGLMGALSIIRFRNIIKDTRDIAFIFSALVIGMASGSQRYIIAIIGTLSICTIIVYLHFSEFGSHRPHNAFLRFSFSGYIDASHPVIKILKKFCGNYALISSQGGDPDSSLVEYAYQVMLKNVSKNEQMLSELHSVEGVQNVNLTVQEQLLQI
ncbi:MAG: DUF4956 domain-containing protein [Sedimentisphaerales bacterium]|nr:DUF4956 domain-containing protein [Sedimentisphaerales bacterium]